MFKSLESLITFVFKSIKWIIMIFVLTFIYFFFNSVSDTTKRIDTITTEIKQCSEYKNKMDGFKNTILNSNNLFVDAKFNIDITHTLGGYDGVKKVQDDFYYSCEYLKKFQDKYIEDKCVNSVPINKVETITEVEVFIKENEKYHKNCGLYLNDVKLVDVYNKQMELKKDK